MESAPGTERGNGHHQQDAPKEAREEGKMQRLLTRVGRGCQGGEGVGFASYTVGLRQLAREAVSAHPKGHHGSQMRCHPEFPTLHPAPYNKDAGNLRSNQNWKRRGKTLTLMCGGWIEDEEIVCSGLSSDLGVKMGCGSM